MRNSCKTCPPAECPATERNCLTLESIDTLPVAVFPGPLPSRQVQPVVVNEDRMIYPLTLQTCWALAKDTGTGAATLEQEAVRFEQARDSSSVLAEVLRMQARQVRNDGVANGLNAWFNLLKICLQHDVLIESAGRIDTTVATVGKLRVKGLAMQVDVGSFDRKENELEDQQSVLAAGQQDVAGILHLLLNLQRDPEHPLVSDPRGMENWRPAFPPDLEVAVETALAYRQDLAILQRLSVSQDIRTLDAIRKSLAEVYPLLASAIERNFASGPVRKLRLKVQLERELENRRSQLCTVLEQTREKIRLEVAEAIHAIERSETGIRLRQESLASIDQSLELLDAAAKIRQVDLTERTTLQSRRLELESELVDQLIARELAWVRLLKSQGLLAGAAADGN